MSSTHFSSVSQSIDGAAHSVPDDLGISAHLFQACVGLSGIAAANIDSVQGLQARQQRALNRAGQTLRLWGLRHRVLNGGLDSILQTSKNLQYVVVQTLRAILQLLAYKILSEIFPPEERPPILNANKVDTLLEQAEFVEFDQDESNSDSSAGSSCSENHDQYQGFDQMISTLRREVASLNDLNASLISPALDLEQIEDVADIASIRHILPHHAYSSSIMESFPDASPELVNRLGECNFHRYQHLLELRAGGAPEPRPLKHTRKTFQTEPAMSEASRNVDSGYGSMTAPASTTYAPTIASKKSSHHGPFSVTSGPRSLTPGEHSKYPPLPAAARSGAEFNCLACGRGVIARETLQWKNHLVQDLQPYTCIFPTCQHAGQRLANSKTWREHLQSLEHSKEPIWQTYRYHIAKHMEDIALLSLPGTVEEDPIQNGDFTGVDDHLVSPTQQAGFVSGLKHPYTPRGDVYIDASNDQKSRAPAVDVSSYATSRRDAISESRPRGIPNRDYILDLVHAQKLPATFQCSFCPKRFTRAYNLRSHLRTHTDERPFVCSLCGKAFARQHDRKRHEGLHSGEKKFECRGPLNNDGQLRWGCGRRFVRVDALARHFRSEAGRVCIKPLLDKEALEHQNAQNDQDMEPVLSAMLPEALETPPGYDPNTHMYRLPEALLQQYPTLGQKWDALSTSMGALPTDLDDFPLALDIYDGYEDTAISRTVEW
ncbi:hypothetical protein FKW77_003951 [Venturia effusa]|uniref:C2H2-type domain-containing protein n=1 Tax=Venturia effusa TaxID=50376 RepID=A0A517L577_9PEZI|nr:hypothetical protein FKW77_003951 [Venturia effusa]